jgi:hypothetical protein
MHTHSINKLVFKDFLNQSGLRAPRHIDPIHAAIRPEFDYIFKGAVGSFGYQIAGPFRCGQPIGATYRKDASQAEGIYAEEFIAGNIIKIWFWGSRSFYAQKHNFPIITGDGSSTVDDLIQKRLQWCGLDWQTYHDRAIVLDCLKFQAIEPGNVIEAGRTLWLDYRYGRNYEPHQGIAFDSDNALPELLKQTGEQIAAMGASLVGLLKKEFNLPVLISVDAMLDADSNLWWLEMNTNPMVPPECYEVMFSELFA